MSQMDPYYVWNSDVSVLYATCTRKGFLSPLFLFPVWCLQDTLPALSTLGRGSRLPRALWADGNQLSSGPALTNRPTLLQVLLPCGIPHVRDSAGSLELTQHRIRNRHFLMRSMWVSWNHQVLYSLPKAWLPGLRKLPGLTELGQAGAVS